MKIVLLAALAVCSAAAQSLTEPPPLVRLHRHQGAFQSLQPYADAALSVNVVGMAAMTGPAETWLIESHDSFSSIEDVDKAVRPAQGMEAMDHPSSGILANSGSLIAVYRPAFSYRPEQAIEALQKARYCQVSIYQVHPGSEPQFAELVKSRRIAFDSVNLDRPDIAYYVLSGAASGIYVFLAPLSSLKVLDDGPRANADNFAAESAKTSGLTREHLLFRVEPSASWVTDEFASADPEFWHGKAKTQ
jgi:hypothetical protein